MKLRYILMLLNVVLGLHSVFAQKADSTLTLDFEQAKALLLKQNLEILATTYGVSMAEAEVLQAKLWVNPYFIWNQDLYSVELNQYFNFGNQRLIQIEQTFSVAGKHVNTVRLAKVGVELSKHVLSDVVRGLQYELAEKFSELQILQEKEAIYQNIIAQYKQITQAAEAQLRVGTIAGNEFIRLKSEAVALEATVADNRIAIESVMAEVRTLLNLKENVRIKALKRNLNLNPTLNKTELISTAISTRPDFFLAQSQIEYEKQNLRLQRSLAMPDLKLAYQPHDKGSNYVRPYQGFNFEMSLPIFNRNQGAIKGAKVRIDQAETNFQQTENKVSNEVSAAFERVKISRQSLEQYQADFMQQVDFMNQNARSNYDKRTMSLIEFIDSQRIYTQTQIQYIERVQACLQAINLLHFTVGKSIVE